VGNNLSQEKLARRGSHAAQFQVAFAENESHGAGSLVVSVFNPPVVSPINVHQKIKMSPQYV